MTYHTASLFGYAALTLGSMGLIGAWLIMRGMSHAGRAYKIGLVLCGMSIAHICVGIGFVIGSL